MVMAMDLKKAARDAGQSGIQIAHTLHVTEATVSRWLTRKVLVPSRYVAQLSVMLAIDPMDILPPAPDA